MRWVVYAVGSPFVFEVYEILRRAGMSVSAYVLNQPDGRKPHGLEPLLLPSELGAGLLACPLVIPLITPGHRKRVLAETTGLGFTRYPPLLDPTAVTASSDVFEDGSVINAGVVVGANCRFGRFTLLNRSTSIGHDVTTGEFVTIGPGSVVSGSCHIGRGAFVGAGAVVIPEVAIGENSVVGAGAVVTKDVPANCTVAGNPARILREHIAGYNDSSV